jgi:hypothetical protein
MMQRCQPASLVGSFARRNIRACRVCAVHGASGPKNYLSRFSETIRAHGADCHSHVTRCSRLSGSSSSSLRTVGPISNEATSDLSWNGLGRFRDRVSGPESRRIVRAGNYSSLTAAQSSPLGDYRRVIGDEGQAGTPTSRRRYSPVNGNREHKPRLLACNAIEYSGRYDACERVAK